MESKNNVLKRFNNNRLKTLNFPIPIRNNLTKSKNFVATGGPKGKNVKAKTIKVITNLKNKTDIGKNNTNLSINIYKKLYKNYGDLLKRQVFNKSILNRADVKGYTNSVYNSNMSKNDLKKVLEFLVKPSVYVVFNDKNNKNGVGLKQPAITKMSGVLTGKGFNPDITYRSLYVDNWYSGILESGSEAKNAAVMFLGASGAGKTFISDRLIARTGNIEKTTVFAPKFDVIIKGKTTSIRLTEEVLDKITDEDFAKNYIHPTPLNPASSRAHKIIHIKDTGSLVGDLAGNESMSEIYKRSLGFNIFSNLFKGFAELKDSIMESAQSRPDLQKTADAFQRQLGGIITEASNPGGSKKGASVRFLTDTLGIDLAAFDITSKTTKLPFFDIWIILSIVDMYLSPTKSGVFNHITNIKSSITTNVKLYNYIKGISNNDEFVKKIQGQKPFVYVSDMIKRCLEGLYITRSLEDLKLIYDKGAITNSGGNHSNHSSINAIRKKSSLNFLASALQTETNKPILLKNPQNTIKENATKFIQFLLNPIYSHRIIAVVNPFSDINKMTDTNAKTLCTINHILSNIKCPLKYRDDVIIEEYFNHKGSFAANKGRLNLLDTVLDKVSNNPQDRESVLKSAVVKMIKLYNDNPTNDKYRVRLEAISSSSKYGKLFEGVLKRRTGFGELKSALNPFGWMPGAKPGAKPTKPGVKTKR